MIQFIFGAVFGCFVGVCVMAICNAASRADEQSEKYFNKKGTDK